MRTVHHFVVTAIAVLLWNAADLTRCGAWQDSQPAQLMAQIRADVAAKNWEAVEASMTAEAWDSFSAQLVVECLTLANMDFDFVMPGGGGPDLDEYRDALFAALEKHHLDDISVPQPTFRIVNGDSDDDSKDSAKHAGDDQEAARKQALQRIGDGDEQRQAVADLWAAKSDSPLSMSYLVGKVEAESTEGDTCTLQLKPQNTRTRESDGFAIIIATPPVFVDVVRTGDTWKFAGINRAKTDEARKNFRPDIAGPKTDF